MTDTEEFGTEENTVIDATHILIRWEFAWFQSNWFVLG